MSAKTVQTFASHSGIQVTVDRYGYLFPTEYHKKAMDEIAEGLFGWRTWAVRRSVLSKQHQNRRAEYAA